MHLPRTFVAALVGLSLVVPALSADVRARGALATQAELITELEWTMAHESSEVRAVQAGSDVA